MKKVMSVLLCAAFVGCDSTSNYVSTEGIEEAQRLCAINGGLSSVREGRDVSRTSTGVKVEITGYCKNGTVFIRRINRAPE